tara:strand:+ start:413 stop:1276 length:864 start_codon:yes stop_codon:yes gene_type:complete
MAQPTTRTEFKEYVLRRLGAPVLDVNLASEQCEDLIDDALQYFYERHFDGVQQCYLKYQITDDDVLRGKARPPGVSGESQTGITTTTVTQDMPTKGSTDFSWYENSNYIPIPNHVIGINKIFQYDNAQSISVSNMFSFKYQLFLNDIYYWGQTDLLSYSMTMSYLETMNFLLNTHKQIRFNQRQDRLYLDVDWSDIKAKDYIIIDCWRTVDPVDFPRVWNDSFLKPYATALFKKQWGQNLIKFQGVKLPGGIEFNGRQLYDDGQREIDEIKSQMSNTYELPPLDLIG